MIRRPARRIVAFALALIALGVATRAATRAANAQELSAPPARPGAPHVELRPRITIESPLEGGVVQGVAFLRFRTENVSIESPFLPAEQRRSPLPAGHLHVTVDGALWHWMHTTTDPVVVTPLPPGEHTVELELAGADHKRLDVRTVQFTVKPKSAPGVAHHAAP